MATATMPKASRLDLRMTEGQKRRIETAASINGMSVSQWSLSRLMESARKDIAEQNVIMLADEEFESFARLLDEPEAPQFEAFKSGTTRWDR